MTLGIGNVGNWRNAFLESVQELSIGFLGGTEVIVTGEKQEMPYALLGAFVQVVCSEGPVLLGITGTSASCHGLAKLMLGMDLKEPIGEDDANDAVGELINITAGLIKTKLSNQLGNIELGLPVFLSGRLRAIGRIAVASTEVKIGPYPCELLVFALTGR
ncbi:MAG TPA: chemotaxis protein CheX [Polyangiaceae bacterium]